MAAAPILHPFDANDLPHLQAVRRAAFEPVFRSFREIVGTDIAAHAFVNADAEQAKFLDDICAPESGHRIRVVWIDGKIAGFVSFTVDSDTRTGEIGLNAVHPDHAGRGAGTWMFNEVLAEMKALGMAVATVSTGGDGSHAPARRAYEKAGFGPAIPSISLYRRL